MSTPDLNLLLTLEALLTEGSVAAAARRLRLSPSAMSRSLARLRETTGDPLLVRAGRGLVPTPRAIELRESVGPLVAQARATLRPGAGLDLARLVRDFTLRCGEGFVENFGATLLARVAAEAPGVRLRFAPKPDKDSRPLRDGHVDLETGVVGQDAAPELRAQALLRDRFVGVVRTGHALARAPVTLEQYLAGAHVAVSRRGIESGPVDLALQPLGLRRQVVVMVGGFSGALALARGSDLIATVAERHSAHLLDGMHRFELPVAPPPITVSLLWHPRFDADPAHRWLRGCLRETCAGLLDPS